jgi:hypothetical protein
MSSYSSHVGVYLLISLILVLGYIMGEIIEKKEILGVKVETYIGISVAGTLTVPTTACTLDLAIYFPGALWYAVLVPAAVCFGGRGHVVGDYANFA